MTPKKSQAQKAQGKTAAASPSPSRDVGNQNDHAAGNDATQAAVPSPDTGPVLDVPFTYGSVCSGIEAPTVAWHPLGWTAAWYSEIEPFPCAVLAHHYPNTPNLGDMTRLNEHPGRTAIKLLVGGTPCQSFSVAGLRKGMDDARGNLALVFILLLRRTGASWVLWENVPGVLSSNGGRDLASFFGGLVGREIAVPEEGWGGGGAGIIEPTTKNDYGIAWRVLDAQHFGIPQRRRRIFVVGYLGDWRPAAAVLLELHSVSGNPPPSREAGKGTAGGSGPSFTPSQHGAYCEGVGTLRSNGGDLGGGSENLILGPSEVTHSLTQRYDSSEDGTGRGVPLGPTAPTAFYAEESRADNFPPADMAPPMKVKQHLAVCSEVLPAVTPCWDGGQTADTLTKASAGGNQRAGDQGGDVVVTPAIENFDCRGRGDGTTSPTLCTDHASRPSDMCPVITEPIGFTHEETPKWSRDCSQSLDAQNGRRMSVATKMAVRRLTPVECERLQGFPDNYTNVPYRGKPAADGPRYKALGNSMAVPVMAWIGRRIKAVEDLIKTRK